MPKKKKSILRKLFKYMMSFGILMGFIFPVYAHFFVIWKDGLFIYFLIGSVMAGIIVGIVSFSFVKIILIKELLKVSGIAKNITDKDISVDLELCSDDAVGEIANGFSEIIKLLNSFVSQTHKITNNVKRFNGNSKDHSINEITHLNNSIQEVNLVSDNISSLSNTIQNEIKLIQSAVLKSGETLKSIDKKVEVFSEKMNLLQDKTGEINTIINIIKDIAEKTNLLALNASIEASKAGEFGKSFAVVANEVRLLSGNINESVKQINNISSSINLNLSEANDINNDIMTSFKSNLMDNIKFSEIVKEVETHASSSITENSNLVISISALKDIVLEMNHSFDLFYSSVSNLNAFTKDYKTNVK